MTHNNQEYQNIIDEFDTQKDYLEKQITNIEIRQQEIQNHIISIENANNHLDMLISIEKDDRKKGIFHSAKIRNIEILTKLYSVYREFEDIKNKYFNNITDIIYKSHKLIEVEIRRIDEKLDKLNSNDMSDMFKRLIETFSSKNLEENKELEEKLHITEDEYKI